MDEQRRIVSLSVEQRKDKEKEEVYGREGLQFTKKAVLTERRALNQFFARENKLFTIKNKSKHEK